MMDRSVEFIIAILGIMKAGGIYLPIDPDLPEERKTFMLKDSRAFVCVGNDGFSRDALCGPPGMGEYKIRPYGSSGRDSCRVNGHSNRRGEPRVRPVSTTQSLNPSDISSHSAAYIIYTSGTTGKPKGTLLEHRGIAALKSFWETRFNIDESDRILQFAKSSFDASIWDIFMALTTGAGLWLIPAETISTYSRFQTYLNTNRITVATLPPPYVIHLDPRRIKTLRLLITAGSETSFELVEKWRSLAGVEYVNAYGPTETTVCATWWKAVDNADYKNRAHRQPHR